MDWKKVGDFFFLRRNGKRSAFVKAATIAGTVLFFCWLSIIFVQAEM